MNYIKKAVPAGGLTNSKLALATATEADVLNGRTFYAGNKELKTGAYSTDKNICIGTMYNNGVAGNFFQAFSNPNIADDLSKLSSAMGVTTTIRKDGVYKIAFGDWCTAIDFTTTFKAGNAYNKSFSKANKHIAVTDDIELSTGDVVSITTGGSSSSGNPYNFIVAIIKVD